LFSITNAQSSQHCDILKYLITHFDPFHQYYKKVLFTKTVQPIWC